MQHIALEVSTKVGGREFNARETSSRENCQEDSAVIQMRRYAALVHDGGIPWEQRR